VGVMSCTDANVCMQAFQNGTVSWSAANGGSISH
jgi:uncharacterized protein with LGFP repeats